MSCCARHRPVQAVVERIDQRIRDDAGHRGLAGHPGAEPLCPGHLLGAACELSGPPGRAVVCTGFYVPHGSPAAAETDGPPGAAFLARVLQGLGWSVGILTDRGCRQAVAAAVVSAGLDPALVSCGPRDPDAWLREELSLGLTHLIAVERVGPSHTLASLRGQSAGRSVPESRFERLVAGSQRDRCHNMHGQPIEAWTAPLHLVFDRLREYPEPVSTIGVGDGGNEIGMGCIGWEQLEQRLGGGVAGRVVCRVATRWNVIAGTSNWGAWGLAASALLLSGRAHRVLDWAAEDHGRILTDTVEQGPAVDGVTGNRVATVDGLPMSEYLAAWCEIQRQVAPLAPGKGGSRLNGLLLPPGNCP
ncbi:MAG: glutamate cyclase domain-containing protein [Planctomycetaceae bacterium]